MAFPALTEVEGKVNDRRKALADIFAEAGSDMDMSKIKSVEGDPVEKIREINDELTDLVKERDRLMVVKRAADAAKAHESDGSEGGPAGEGSDGITSRTKTFGDLFVEANLHLKATKGQTANLDLPHSGVKALFETGAGWAPDVVRGPRLVPSQQRPIQVVDLIPNRPTGQTSITFMEETTFTNAAAEVAEGGAKPEAALALTERNSPVRKIAVWIPVTDEQLEDVEGIRAYLNNRLTFMVRQRLDLQILTGNGTAPNLRGLLNVVGIQTQAKGTDPVPDAIHKAMTKVRVVGQSVPNLLVMHPNDWQDVRLLRTADGVYIWGNPSDAGPERMWGLQVSQAQALTENTGLVVDTQFTELAIKSGMEVAVSDSHSTFFVENKQAVRAEMRAALVAYRPQAICTVTGI